MKVNESVRIEREEIIKARQEDIRRRKVERERKEREEKKIKEREEKIRIEKEKERKEKIRKEIEKKERIKREKEEKERIKMKGFFKRFAKLWKEESLGDKIAITFGMILFTVGPIIMISEIASYFDSFEQFMDAAVALFILIVIAILGMILSSPSVTYTKPHRYIVKGELDKDYKKEEDFGTTIYTRKRR